MNTSSRLPAIFIGHGSPMAAFEDNQYTRGWADIAARLPRPRAIVCVSAHWYTQGTGVTAMAQPRTIHDFYGFPDELYQYHYRAAGDPHLAHEVAQLLAPLPVVEDQQWGLDHGSWTVLKHMYPQADIPVLQLSIDGTQPPQWHYDLGRRLSVLREQGVLLMGSGNVVHNLRQMRRAGDAPAHAWAESFNRQVRAGIEQHDHEALIDYQRFGDDAKLSVPTPEHYLPLLYVLGASHADESVRIPIDDVSIGSISMLSVVVGDVPASQ
ncbi:MAG: 4,5-DOPA dioxygenase extradiol [Steroidobacteraceae bacterium]